MNIRQTYWVVGLLLLAACGRPTTKSTQLNGRGFGGGDTVASALLSDRTRAANVITSYLSQGDPNHHLCDASLVSDEPFLQTALAPLANDPGGAILANLQANLLTHNELLKWRDALLGATMRVSDNASDVSVNGVVKDAYTVGLQITYYRPNVTPMSDFRRVALELHEASHAETSGWLDTAMIGSMMGLQAIDMRAACFVALMRSIEASQAAVVSDFTDEFDKPTGTGLSASWHNRNVTPIGVYQDEGFLIPSAPGEFWADVPGVSRADMRVRATVDFNCAYASASTCWVGVIGRNNGTTLYNAGVGRTGNQIGLTLYYYNGSTWVALATAPIITAVPGSSNTYEVELRIVGQSISASIGGVGVSITDSHVTGSGTAGIRFSNLAIDRFEIDEP